MESSFLKGKDLDQNLIPVISLENYEQNYERIAQEIKRACETIGFFYLSNHGLEEQAREAFRYSQQMFTGLTQSQKDQFKITSHSGNRGYCLNAAEELQKGVVDNKEAFNVGKPETDDNQSCWPSDLDLPEQIADFRPKMQSFYDSCHEFVTNRLLNCLAIGLGWEENFFQLNHTEKPHTFRLLHYPPAREASGELSIAAGEHSDYGTITLLFQDQTGGLQVRDLNNDWVNVTPIEGTIVVNIADLLQKWTDGKYVSTKHRVIQKKSSSDRYSMAYFVHPNPKTPVKETTAIEYLLMRLNDTHKY